MVSTIWVPATAQSFSVIWDVKTAAWSSTTVMSTASRTSGVGDGVGGSEGRCGIGVAEKLGSGVTTTVGIVDRSGGGSTKFSIRAVSRSKSVAHAEDVGPDDGEPGGEDEDEGERGDEPRLPAATVHGAWARMTVPHEVGNMDRCPRVAPWPHS